MPAIPPTRLVALQSNPQNIRNICILAHVDHGKTSLTDSLIATNGIIAPKMAGKIRYLDSRPDEQQRGITMESSAISLYFSMMRRQQEGEELKKEEYLINLIDSPGHIDFSSEVSTASRLSDAAVVLVDAVEGVCSQTVTVLRQVWIEKLKPLLVINKIDRLITELKMSPAEAHSHLERVLEGVNAVIGGFFAGERMEEDLLWRDRQDSKKAEKASGDAANSADPAVQADLEKQFEERDDEDLYFEPERNNVIFASAIDGWAFTVSQFAGIYEKKLGIKRSVLKQVLWGDFYLDPKTKKVLGQKHLKGRNLKPIFVQLVLEPLWAVYEATVGGPNTDRGDPALLEKITKSLNVTIPAHIARSRDSKAILQAVFSSWLPLSTALLVSVIEFLPSPADAQATRIPELMEDVIGADHVDKNVRDAMVHFKAGKNDPVVAYVSKMVAIPESELPSKRRKLGSALTADEARELARKKRAEIAKAQAEADGVNGTDGVTNGIRNAMIGEEETENVTSEQPQDPEHLIGFARLFSGQLSVGDEVYVLPPKFNPAQPHASLKPKKVVITALYLLMGRSLEALETVRAGTIFGIEGLEGHILKTGTLCSQLEGGINLAGTNSISQPIVRVALEPTNPLDLSKMVRGLKLLEQSDPSAVYEQMPSGEHVILTAGELHLERCLKDLRERFARCDIQPGEPIVPYRETTIKAEEMEPPKNKDLPRGTLVAITASKTLSVRLRVRPLPTGITDFLIQNGGSLRRLYAEKKAAEDNTQADHDPDVASKPDERQEFADLGNETGNERSKLSLQDFRGRLQETFDSVKEDRDVWKNIVQHVSAFGPRRTGPNILIDATGMDTCKRFLLENEEIKSGQFDITETSSASHRTFADTITYAFQLATAQGPLCREPMQGVAVFLEKIDYAPQHAAADSAGTENGVATAPDVTEIGRLTGELIPTTREAIRTAFLDWSPRILLAMYSCTIQATPEILGRVYDVLNRRRGAILSENLLEGTPYFTIEATLPVAESFGFSDEIRKRTSGLAQPMLRFTGFETPEDVNIDPFWVPRTEEELEDLGEVGERENVAKKYVDSVRRRKGLLVKGARGVGRNAEKQRNLKTN
ncbi:Cytoplasmic GTPase/eEF2-like protein (ribosomal biogenesis) [Neophaeococcomyces mojaviensis]|uniref:Cytoplasmic GTPase/eEF2-like protein (Ribosomal biogenesis) n=1 Tax=Neophaeococcomyces mojaviensis TaxID=3383035 RepID=A0ACC3AIE8_9EURO|nr:Cytoplasmic GTPase/eEF2-like protein (ribosomal biogenesis) [Knufia sp. JES_112]